MNISNYINPKFKCIKLFYFTSIFLIVYGVIVKFTFKDEDLGARIIGFEKRLLSSDIIFILGIAFLFLGFVFNFLLKKRNPKLSEGIIYLNYFLIIGLIFIFCLTAFLETYFSEWSGKDSIFKNVFIVFGAISIIAFMVGIVLLIITILKNLILLLFEKKRFSA